MLGKRVAPPLDDGSADLDPAALARGVSRAVAALGRAQDPGGSWKGDYGGPLFLLPIYVSVCRAARIDIPAPVADGMVRYLRRNQRADGSWGLHVEGQGHVFTTVLNYVALRLLGVGPDDRDAARARGWFRARGGPGASASWGKFTLALLGLYDYRGLDPVPPELWLLPRSAPVHPGRLWCHCRMVYLPMSYLYGRRYVADREAVGAGQPGDLIDALRSELYDQPYDAIDWNALRDRVSPTDSYAPVSPVMKTVNRVLALYERRPSRRVRERALAFVLEQIDAEDRNTNYICIGPISKLFHTLIWHSVRPEGPEFRAHEQQLADYLWRADTADGETWKMQGYNSSELWDTTFAVQAVVEADIGDSARPIVEGAHRFIDDNQVRDDVPDREAHFRCPSTGGWPFSDRAHGWPITDCTAEGMKAAMALEPVVDRPIAEHRLAEAADLLLWWQNDDGGWATYERTRGAAWLEQLNPSNCFADIMIDYPYVECTSAAVQALSAFRSRYPHRRSGAIDAAIAGGADWIRKAQRADGSWYGSWGVCFTYGTWFGVSGLRAAGAPANDPAIARACEFLARHQAADGGWGESADSSRDLRYVPTESSQAVMTAWAVLALSQGPREYRPAAERGGALLLSRQSDDGQWPQEHISGMFNKTCAIHYDNYVRYFPLWALARLARTA